MDRDIKEYTIDDVAGFFKDNVDAIVAVDVEKSIYHVVQKKGLFSNFFDDDGDYNELIKKLWFHFNDSGEQITEDYQVFIPSLGKCQGKMSRRLKVFRHGILHVVQMTVYPVEDSDVNIIILDELHDSEYEDELKTNNKVNTIQNTYLFSMYVDLVKDVTSSISITEISEDTVNTQIKYSDWRMMIVNMIWPDDQKMFLEKTDPEYLMANFKPGHTASFDCLMQNLEGKYIWVKLIFSRAETNFEDDFRFVFMVQDIHENTVELMSTLKKYEEMASLDPLTGVLNHGRIETELGNAVENARKSKRAVSAMIIDIDFFKQVNDTYGHSVGDMTLKQFAGIIRGNFTDGRAVVGRWGGEEFVTICYDMDIRKLKEVAEELREKVAAETFKAVGHITCSIGITCIKLEDEADFVFERMDKALYEAKSDGRNCTRCIEA